MRITGWRREDHRGHRAATTSRADMPALEIDQRRLGVEIDLALIGIVQVVKCIGTLKERKWLSCRLDR